FGLWDFVKEEKAKGTIRHYGFSFHDGPELLERILSAHPDVDFVQLQINYADWENPKVTSRANYEVARKYGIPIVVMEPVKGGTLANPPRDVKALLTDYAPDASPASWAIRFVASLDGILSVLSGMSNIAQMEDNLSYMRDFQPLSAQEMEVIHEAQRLLGHSKTIACTSCHYCTEGCPKQIPIPEIFSALNLELGSGQGEAARENYRKILEKGNGADACIACGQCERRCPQHLNIIESLKQAASELQ
ncbi:MAG: aldo/keto reductase, partial [Clostridia bacterium]|nr:aldo/keto reductase [Clostridia bacterium]